ncbi:hypothetical protein SOCE26_054300 [Sorangium cellulosum]|uniref:Secreted protein n=1 Tax=Sorangium cellulosum TaxID=56 RepID=A0A2L0EXE9_SORCE|nr:hypothetical protein [Sorangium cellulosum]AUX43973.1 hypothetical protein SOCE26_054300 [Sorangium cellulosum]
MNARRFALLIVAISIWALAACNWTIGDCYPVGEGTSGVGAGPGSEPRPIFTSAGSGDFGAEPPDGPYDGSERKIACNEWELEDEEERPSDSSETTTYSPESPRDPCAEIGDIDIVGDGATFLSCSDACSSKCPPGMAPYIHVDFDPSEFKFVTIVEDDGKDEGGGWQEAKVNLKFEYAVVPGGKNTWYCALTIKMPIRTKEMGLIDLERAVSLSEEITEYVGYSMRNEYKLPPGIFCRRFIDNADAAFKLRYPDLGARVTK